MMLRLIALAAALVLAGGIGFTTIHRSAAHQPAAPSYNPLTGRGAIGYQQMFSGQAFVHSLRGR